MWPLVYIKNVNKYFPEYKETQFGHMTGQRVELRSTKKVSSKPEELSEEEKEGKLMVDKNDILIKIYKVQKSFDEE